jgi:hypothetical protein
MMPAIGVRPPVLTLVVVRAMAPVAAKPPKSGAAMLARPLGDQFLVGVVAVIDLAVGDTCREQRLDGAEQGDGDGRRDQFAEIVNRQAGEPKLGSSCGMPLKRLPMVSTGRLEDKGHQRADDKHDERPGGPAHEGKALGQSVVGKQENKTDAGQGQRRQVDGMGIGGQRLDAAEKLGGQVVDLQPEEILDLGEKNDDGDAVGEADDHGDRNEADQLPHASEPMASRKTPASMVAPIRLANRGWRRCRRQWG